MTGSQLRRLLRPALAGRPDLAMVDRLVFHQPIGWCLAGAFLDSASHAASDTYVLTTVQPLYVPAEMIHFTVASGLRAPGSHRFTVPLPLPLQPGAGEESLDRLLDEVFGVVLPFAISKMSPAVIASELFPPTAKENPHVLEALAYSAALTGQASVARQAIAFIDNDENPLNVYSWMRDLAGRARTVRQILDSGEDPTPLFRSWRATTLERLGLTRYAAAV